ncbi:MAG: ATP-binding protein [Candidatus Omnitrophota bacterium]
MYKRILKEHIRQRFFKARAVIITGARQTGKTTLAQQLIEEAAGRCRSFNCDNPDERNLLTEKNLDFLKQLIGDAKFVFIDEGQKVSSIGQTVKLLVDYYKDTKQIIVSGSSSINLLHNTQEALTGRKYTYRLFPLSLEEIYPDKDLLRINKGLEGLLIFGAYPEVVSQGSFDEKRELLQELHSSYLYKDVLEFRQIRNADPVIKLVRALALQIGSEVSYSELAGLIGVDKKTVERYIDLLEKSFVIFRLSAYGKNKRREISRMKKIYFYDLGIRNAVINNFNFLDSRSDVGALWENFALVERIKYRQYHNIYANQYFWRTYDGSEVDLVEERDGRLDGYEFRWKEQRRRMKRPSKWLEYPKASLRIITNRQLSGFVL